MHAPDRHVLVATRHESLVLEGVEFKAENRVKSEVPKRERPVLLPLEDLDAECAVHPDRAQDFAVRTESQVQDTALMRSFQYD